MPGATSAERGVRRPRPAGTSNVPLVVAAALAGAAVAALLFLLRPPPEGGLVAPTDVTIATIDTTPVRPKPKPPPPPKATERPCWTTFGGRPTRDLSRPSIHLGAPARSLWATRDARPDGVPADRTATAGST